MLKRPNFQTCEINVVRIVPKDENGCFLNSFLLRKGGGFEDRKCIKGNFILEQIIENHSLN